MLLSVNVSSIIVHDNKALVLKRNLKLKHYPGLWTIPGGGMEPTDRTIEDCAIREAKEETNIDIVVDKLIANNHTSKALFLIFSAKIRLKPFEIKLQLEEASDYKWVSRDEVSELEFTPYTKELLLREL